jgi:hypothetical protein
LVAVKCLQKELAGSDVEKVKVALGCLSGITGRVLRRVSGHDGTSAIQGSKRRFRIFYDVGVVIIDSKRRKEACEKK